MRTIHLVEGAAIFAGNYVSLKASASENTFAFDFPSVTLRCNTKTVGEWADPQKTTQFTKLEPTIVKRFLIDF